VRVVRVKPWECGSSGLSLGSAGRQDQALGVRVAGAKAPDLDAACPDRAEEVVAGTVCSMGLAVRD
jgi:ribosomal protein L11